jgi:hypothetical protein
MPAAVVEADGRVLLDRAVGIRKRRRVDLSSIAGMTAANRAEGRNPVGTWEV